MADAPRRGGGWLALAILAAGAAALLLAGSVFEAPDARGGRIRLVALAVLLAILAPALFRGGLPRNLRNLLVWMLMLGALSAGYAAWRDSGLGGPAPTAGRAIAPASAESLSGVARFRANRRGDFVVPAAVDGVRVTFLVDTGASQVVLSRGDARRVGFDPERLRYTLRFRTANGEISGAPVRLREVVLGGVRITGVRASVADSDLGTSLLGMSFINRLSAFELRDGVLTMRR